MEYNKAISHKKGVSLSEEKKEYVMLCKNIDASLAERNNAREKILKIM